MKPKNLLSLKGIVLLCVIAWAGALIPACPLRAEPVQPAQNTPGALLKTVSFSVEGMSCASCASRVKRTLKALDGVIGVDVSLEERRARVQYIEEKVSAESIAAAIRDLGYKTGEPAVEKDP